MGFFLTENIFFGDQRQGYKSTFGRYRYQAVVLFSQHEHPEMARTFYAGEEERASFIALDKSTGKNVCFFACQIPPKTFESDGRIPGKPIPIDHDDRVVMRLMSEFFGLGPCDLPAVVLSPNLWRGEVVVLPQIDRMEAVREILHELVNIAEHKRPASDAQLEAHFGKATPARRIRPKRENDTVKETFKGYQNCLNGGGFRKDTYEEIEKKLKSVSDELSVVIISDGHAKDLRKRLISLAPFLSLPSTVPDTEARLPPLHLPDWYERLHPRSQSMMLMALHLERAVKLESFGLGQEFRDYAPLLSGLWRTVEMELNLSFYQLARQHAGIPMPLAFARYFEHPGRFKIGHKKKQYDVNLRKENSALGGDLSMCMLGNGREMVELLVSQEAMPFMGTYQQCVRQAGTHHDEVVKHLTVLNQVRRAGSHPQTIEVATATEQRAIIMEKPLIETMLLVKEELSGPERPPQPSLNLFGQEAETPLTFQPVDDLFKGELGPARAKGRPMRHRKEGGPKGRIQPGPELVELLNRTVDRRYAHSLAVVLTQMVADRRGMTQDKLLKKLEALLMGGTKLLSRMARDPELKQDVLDALLEDAE